MLGTPTPFVAVAAPRVCCQQHVPAASDASRAHRHSNVYVATRKKNKNAQDDFPVRETSISSQRSGGQYDESLSDAYGIAHCRAAKEQSNGAVHVHLAAFIPDGNLRGVFQFCFVILPQACGIQGAPLLMHSFLGRHPNQQRFRLPTGSGSSPAWPSGSSPAWPPAWWPSGRSRRCTRRVLHSLA